MRKPIILFSLFLALLSFPLLAAEKQLRVTAERAPIYAEAHTDSYRIEIIRKGTILTIFTSGESKSGWHYVSYSSKRWNSRVTGFIQASMVEEVSDKPIPEKPLEIAAEKKEKAPPQKQIEETQERIEKTKVAPEKKKPKIEQVIVKESVGVSSVLASKFYVLPESMWEDQPRAFLAVDTKPANTESIKKQDETIAAVTKKIPEELQERQPPEVVAAKPKETEPEEKQVVQKIKPEEPPKPKKPKIPGQQSLVTMSVGYGPSAGSGFGAFIQLNTKMGVSVHLGAGYYPTTYFYSEYDWATNQILYSAGIKYYLPFNSNQLRPYVNLQYGGISIEAVRIITGIWHYQYVFENIQKTLYGPSFLAGMEWRLTDNVGLNGAIGLSYNTTEWDYWERDYFLTAEVGLLVDLW